MRKKDNIVINLFDFAADLLATLHPQLDSFAAAPLQDTEDGRVRLQAGFILRERADAGYCSNHHRNKKGIGFHNQLVLRDFWSIGQQINREKLRNGCLCSAGTIVNWADSRNPIAGQGDRCL